MKDEELINQIFEHLHPDKPESEQITDEAFDLIDVFVDKYPNEDLAELVYNSTINSNEIWKISCVLDIMIWSTMDNGEKLLETTSSWIQGTNKRKLELALY